MIIKKIKKMLIELIKHLYQDSYSVEGTRQERISPDVIERKGDALIKRTVPDKFKADIEVLEAYVGQQLQSGLCINVTLMHPSCTTIVGTQAEQGPRLYIRQLTAQTG